jgi:AcrR family transcriptional regulator
VKVIVSHNVARAYEQKARAESAAETRLQIIDAVIDRLRKAPAERISVDAVARKAGVARSTVYLIFGSRAGLFDAVALEVYDRAGYPRLLEAVRVPDPRETLRGGITAGVRIFAAYRDVFRALYSMEELEKEATGGAISRIEGNRGDGMMRLARRLSRHRQLRPGVKIAEAANVLWIAASFEAFDLLYTGRDLSADETARILVENTERAICR